MSLEVGDGHLLPVRDDWATGRSSSCTVIRTGPAMATGAGSTSSGSMNTTGSWSTGRATQPSAS
jgi:hypothetical protein